MDPVSSQQETQQVVTPQPVEQSSQPKVHFSFPKILLILLGIIVVLGLIGGAYYLGKEQKNSNSSIFPSKEIKVSPTEIPTPTIDPTANWKTFTDKKINVTIKYPPTWSASAEEPNNFNLDVIGNSFPTFDIFSPNYPQDPSGKLYAAVFSQIEKIDASQSLSDWVSIHGYGEGENLATKVTYMPTKIDGHEALEGVFIQTQQSFDQSPKQTSPLPIGYKAKLVYIKNGNLVLTIEANGNIKNPDPDLQLFDQMLSTLKFSVANQMPNWQTYKSNTLGLTFSYPPQFQVQESGGKVSINNGTMLAYLLTGKDKYFGCAVPQNVCPQGTSMVINGVQVFKNVGTETSIGGKNLLEYEFIGTNPNNPIVSSDNTYSLYFEYHGDISEFNMISQFNSIANTIHYSYGRAPGPAGN